MKVFFCLKYFLPEHTAGTEVYVYTLAEWLRNAGLDVAILKPTFKNNVIQYSYYNNIKIIEYPESSLVDKQLIIGNRPSSGIEFFEHVLRTEEPDVVHFHELSGSNGITIFHFRVVKKLGIKIFTTMHLIGYVCKTSELRYKGTISCNGIVDKKKCAICVLNKRGVPALVAEGIVQVSRFWGNNLLASSSTSQTILSSLFSYPTYRSCLTF